MKEFVSALLPRLKSAVCRVSSRLLKVLGIAFVACLCDVTGLANSFGSWSSDTTKDDLTCISSLIATYRSAPCQNLLSELDSGLWSISEKSKTAVDSATSLSILKRIVALDTALTACESRGQDVLDVHETSSLYGTLKTIP